MSIETIAKTLRDNGYLVTVDSDQEWGISLDISKKELCGTVQYGLGCLLDKNSSEEKVLSVACSKMQESNEFQLRLKESLEPNYDEFA